MVGLEGRHHPTHVAAAEEGGGGLRRGEAKGAGKGEWKKWQGRRRRPGKRGGARQRKRKLGRNAAAASTRTASMLRPSAYGACPQHAKAWSDFKFLFSSITWDGARQSQQQGSSKAVAAAASQPAPTISVVVAIQSFVFNTRPSAVSAYYRASYGRERGGAERAPVVVMEINRPSLPLPHLL